MNIQIQKDHTNLQPLMFLISSSLQDKTTFLSINLHTLTSHNNKTTDTYLTLFSITLHCCRPRTPSTAAARFYFAPAAASMNRKKLHFVQHKPPTHLLLLKHDE